MIIKMIIIIIMIKTNYNYNIIIINTFGVDTVACCGRISFAP